MQEMNLEKVVCFVCGAESEHPVPARTTEDGTPDLDTRPPETRRSTMPTWVQRCPECGYCAPEIATGSPRAARVVKAAAYQALLTDVERPALAQNFLAASAVFEAVGSFGEAGWHALSAAWVYDDVSDDESATVCRERAIEQFASALLVRQSVVDEPGGSDALIADLLRRVGRFGEASARAEAGLLEASLSQTRRVLRYIATLSAQREQGAHTVGEAPAEAPAS